MTTYANNIIRHLKSIIARHRLGIPVKVFKGNGPQFSATVAYFYLLEAPVALYKTSTPRYPQSN